MSSILDYARCLQARLDVSNRPDLVHAAGLVRSALGGLMEAFSRGVWPEDAEKVLFAAEEMAQGGGQEMVPARLMRRLEMDIDLVRRILTLVDGVLPRYVDLPDGLSLFSAAVSAPSHREGGDHFFVLRQGERVVFSLKDQSGHGVNCLARSIVTDLMHQAILHNEGSLGLEDVLALLNRQVRRSNLFSREHGDFFTTMTGEILLQQLSLRLASCGHPPLFLLRGKDIICLPELCGTGHNPPLGLLSGFACTACSTALLPGDRLVLYTDGLSDLFGRGQEGGRGGHELLRDGLAGILARDPGLPVSVLILELVREVAHCSGARLDPKAGLNETPDDVTVLGLEIEDTRAMEELVWQPSGDDDLARLAADLYGRLRLEWGRLGFEAPDKRLGTVLGEAVSNAWRHGNRRDSAKRIIVRYRFGNDFHLEIEDQGQGIDPALVPRPDCGEAEGKGGLYFIRQYSSRATWATATGSAGTRLKLVFKRVPNVIEEECIRKAEALMHLWKTRG